MSAPAASRGHVSTRKGYLNITRLTQGVAVVGAVFGALLLVRPHFTNASIPPPPIQDPYLALERAQTIRDLDLILSDAPSPDREVMRVKQYEDFALAACYGVLSILMALSLKRVHRATLIVGVLGAGAAACDFWENFAILKLIDLPLDRVDPGNLQLLNRVSEAKFLLFAAMLLVCGALYLATSRTIARILGACALAAGAFLASGLFYPALLESAVVTAVAVFLALPAVLPLRSTSSR